jgi:hypothetical protein
MKVTLPDQTIIECTMDELEELVSRGIVGNKLNETKDALGIDIKATPKSPSTPKMPNPWTRVVAVYGCEMPILDPSDPFGDKQTQFNSTKLNSTVLDIDNRQKGKSDGK